MLIQCLSVQPAVPLGAITSAGSLFGVMCICSSWVSQSSKREKYMMFCAGRNTTPTCEKHLFLSVCIGFSSCCLHRLPPFIPLSSLSVRFMTNAALSLPRVLLSTRPRLHPLPRSLLAFSVIAFAVLYFHSFFSCHSLRDWHSHTDWDAESSVTFFFPEKTNPVFENKKMEPGMKVGLIMMYSSALRGQSWAVVKYWDGYAAFWSTLIPLTQIYVAH